MTLQMIGLPSCSAFSALLGFPPLATSCSDDQPAGFALVQEGSYAAVALPQGMFGIHGGECVTQLLQRVDVQGVEQQVNAGERSVDHRYAIVIVVAAEVYGRY